MAKWSGVFANDQKNYGPELALTPPSSTYYGFWISGGEKQPWIEFRMTEEADVKSIKIVDRLSCCPERFERVEVKVGYDRSNPSTTVSCGVQTHKDSTTYTYNCPANARGNYIFIKKHGTTNNWFHVNNVEVSVKCPGM